jgi:hypothetical protein
MTVDVCSDATIINLDHDFLDPGRLGTFKYLLCISRDDTSQCLDSSQVIHVVVDMLVTEEG